jgi:streptogramin lyase
MGLILLSACNKISETEQSNIIAKKKWIVSTVAGSTTPGFTDGDTTQVQFNNAQGIVTDNNGNLFIGDIGNASIRQVTYTGHVTTYAGKNIGNPNPPFGNIYSLVRDNQGNIYTIEYGLIRKIVSPVNSSALAGSLAVNYVDGTGANAAFNVIGNMAIDNQGNIFLPDYDMQDKFHLRKVTPDGVVSTLTLTDNTGFPSNGLPNFYYLYSIAVDAIGNIYVTANGNCMIKKIDPSGNVTILAGRGDIGFTDGKGTAAQFNTIQGMTCDASGNLWVCDGSNHAIREVTPDGTVTTIAGTGSMGYRDGDAAEALFKYPFGITVDKNGVVFIMDNGNNRVRKLEFK